MFKFYSFGDLIIENPLWPILHDIYKQYFEEKLLNLFTFKCSVCVVDDTFVLVDKCFDIQFYRPIYSIYISVTKL